MKKTCLKTLGQIGLAGLMAVTSVLAIPTSGSAHVVRKDSWTMQLPPAVAPLSSELLTEEGQNVRISNTSNSYRIEIPIKNQQKENWYMTVYNRSPEYMNASLTTDDFFWNKETSYIYYYHNKNSVVVDGEEDDGTQIIYLNLSKVGWEPSTETPDNTNQPTQGDEQTGAATDPVQGDAGTETLSLYQAEEGSGTEEGGSSENGAEGENGSTSEGGSESEGDTTTDGGTSSGTTGSGSTTPSSVYIKVTLTYGMDMTDYGEFEEGTGKTISATFYVPLKKSEQEEMTGTLKNCPSQYNPEAAIPLLTGDKGCEVKLNQAENKEFPAMTRYTIGNGRPWILYDGGTIRVPGKTAFAVDLSLTELNPNHIHQQEDEFEEDGNITLLENSQTAEEEKPKLELKAGSNTHNLEYVEVPTANAAGTPFVMTDEYVVLQLPYRWGNALPTAEVEQLKLQDGKLEWVSVNELFKIESIAVSNEIKVSKIGEADAGTYRITFSWTQNGLVLYSLETAFYLRSGKKG